MTNIRCTQVCRQTSLGPSWAQASVQRSRGPKVRSVGPNKQKNGKKYDTLCMICIQVACLLFNDIGIKFDMK